MLLKDFEKYGAPARNVGAAAKAGNLAGGYIVEGDRNIDKVAFAKAASKALFCVDKPGEGCEACINCRKIEDGNYEDLYYIKPEKSKTSRDSTAVSIGEEATKELIRNLMMKPQAGERNIAIVDGGDHMTPAAQNKFLKTLEEPIPGTVIFILSENPEELLPTIRSRCARIRLVDLGYETASEMEEFAEEILEGAVSHRNLSELIAQLDKNVKNKEEGFQFLDAFESVLGRRVRSGGGDISRKGLANAVAFVEEARRNVQRNVLFKYEIRKMILKLEDING